MRTAAGGPIITDRGSARRWRNLAGCLERPPNLRL